MISLPFHTTPEELERIPMIRFTMLSCRLEPEFVDEICRIALFDQGTFNLIELWSKSVSIEERYELVQDMKQSIEEWSKVNV